MALLGVADLVGLRRELERGGWTLLEKKCVSSGGLRYQILDYDLLLI